MQEEGTQGFGTDIAPDTSTTGFGVESGSQQLSLGKSEGVVLKWGRGAKRGQGCFPSGFKVADGGLHSQEWAGSAGGAGRRAGKRPFGAPAPSAL